VRRREFLALISGAAALAPFGATAQPGLRDHWLSQQPLCGGRNTAADGFLEGLEQRGFVIGRNVAIEYRFTEGSFDRLPSLADEYGEAPAARGQSPKRY